MPNEEEKKEKAKVWWTVVGIIPHYGRRESFVDHIEAPDAGIAAKLSCVGRGLDRRGVIAVFPGRLQDAGCADLSDPE
jgi:hypothetical protein